jgi:hypothetical protein
VEDLARQAAGHRRVREWDLGPIATDSSGRCMKQDPTLSWVVRRTTLKLASFILTDESIRGPVISLGQITPKGSVLSTNTRSYGERLLSSVDKVIHDTATARQLQVRNLSRLVFTPLACSASLLLGALHQPLMTNHTPLHRQQF